jgi:fatty acid synthase subunit alpha, fungi type
VWFLWLDDLALITAPNPTKKADLRRAIARDNSANFKIINGVAVNSERLFQTVNVLPGANFRFNFPSSKPQVLCKIWLIYRA